MEEEEWSYIPVGGPLPLGSQLVGTRPSTAVHCRFCNAVSTVWCASQALGEPWAPASRLLGSSGGACGSTQPAKTLYADPR